MVTCWIKEKEYPPEKFENIPVAKVKKKVMEVRKLEDIYEEAVGYITSYCENVEDRTERLQRLQSGFKLAYETKKKDLYEKHEVEIQSCFPYFDSEPELF